MKRILTILLAGFFATAASAQQMDQAAMMKAWEAYMTPGAIHKMLAKSDGKWNTATTLWMDPSQPPMKSTGTCINNMMLGGRYQESIFRGTFMDKPFEGRSILGYDNTKKVFINTFIDNMGTGIMMMQGKWDETTKSITLNGTETDPMTGKDMPVKEVYTLVDDNHHRMEMYTLSPDGKEYKSMEIAFARANPSKK